MGFNSAFKGLNKKSLNCFSQLNVVLEEFFIISKEDRSHYTRCETLV